MPAAIAGVIRKDECSRTKLQSATQPVWEDIVHVFNQGHARLCVLFAY
jgi:hypothetical protein